ncbi:MAG: deoxyguanosinetriphosphate triphosphohydrolase, partial [Candidatus Omnitrophica bacterium]|nr:deoxyguanosinetriphosphate triphosphohydrolase [Candidatus Omnitrophota bacterium]
RFQIIKEIINTQVSDLIIATEKNIKKYGIRSVNDIRNKKGKTAVFSKAMQEKKEQLKLFLFKNLYQHYRVLRMSNKARRFIQELFKLYILQPEQLPTGYQARTRTEDPYRVVCDYIAGMTDRYALKEYKKLFDPYERV